MRWIASIALATGIGGSTSTVTPASASPGTHTLVVVAYEFAFQAPERIPSGVVTVRLVNRGKEGHQVVLARLDDTASLARVIRSLVDDRVHTAGLHWMGGVENALPGDSSEAVLSLPPGRYVIVCEYGSENGHAHVSKGMIRSLVATRVAAAALSRLPPAEVTARLSDYRIELSKTLHSGRQMVRVENVGTHRHHFIVSRIVGKATMAEIDKWDGINQPAPVVDIGAGAAALDPGEASVIPLSLTPGRYLLACILSDGPGSKPHYLRGMEVEADVR